MGSHWAEMTTTAMTCTGGVIAAHLTEAVMVILAVADVLAPVRVRVAAEQDVPLRIFTALSSKAGACAPDFGRRQERNELRETI